MFSVFFCGYLGHALIIYSGAFCQFLDRLFELFFIHGLALFPRGGVGLRAGGEFGEQGVAGGDQRLQVRGGAALGQRSGGGDEDA